MIAFLELMAGALVVLTVVYVAISIYARRRQRRYLEAVWAEQGESTARDVFVAQGLRDYDGSLRRKLILGVYVVPFTLMAVIIYLVNF